MMSMASSSLRGAKNALSSLAPKMKIVHSFSTSAPWDQQMHAGTMPPTTVYWDSKLANSVSLIGNCGRDPELKILDSGKKVCEISIAANNPSPGEEATWYTVVAWDEEAVRLSEHVRKGSSVCVQGRLATDTWVDKQTGQNKSKAKIVLNRFSFVARGGDVGPMNDAINGHGEQQQNGYDGQQRHMQQRSRAALWRSVFDEPDRWWDNRENKINPRAPDYKHKDTGEGLWILSRDDSTPPWVAEMVGNMSGDDSKSDEH